MSEAGTASRLIAALAGVAESARLASIAIEYLGSGEIARVETETNRETRTLLFVSAEAFDAGGARIAAANAVYTKESP